MNGENQRYPFWGYADLFLFLGLSLPSLVAGALLTGGLVRLLHIPVRNRLFEALPAQFLGYGILFGLLAVIFRLHYKRPFWQSLGWTDARFSTAKLILAGMAAAMAVALASVVLRTPDINSPMKEFLSSRSSLVLLVVFGTTLGPLCEELAFRGFVQPLLVRSLGAAPGVILAAVPFGLLHLQQYGWSWRHGLLITAAGASFGWMRHVTGSTRASAIMHMAYNCAFFLALVAQPDQFPRHW
ncbi:MAG: lysostaphin resistance A-like protein [Bryobacteraceae bacterium]